jgi:hypothetical protein
MLMAAPRTATDVRKAANAPLTTIERIALECIRQIASEGRRATKAEICGAIGSDNYEGGTVSGVIGRLEAKGYINRETFQRGMRLCVVATGQCTAPPRDTSPHWRLREENVPTPTIQAVRERNKPIASMIEAEARQLGKAPAEFLADLVYIGWSEYQAEKGE